MSQCLHILSHSRELPERRGECPASSGGVNVPGGSVFERKFLLRGHHLVGLLPAGPPPWSRSVTP